MWIYVKVGGPSHLILTIFTFLIIAPVFYIVPCVPPAWFLNEIFLLKISYSFILLKRVYQLYVIFLEFILALAVIINSTNYNFISIYLLLVYFKSNF